jgi:hypothetical protein
MTAISSGIPMNALLFGQVDTRSAYAGETYARTMAAKIAAYSDFRAAISAPNVTEGESNVVRKIDNKAENTAAMEGRANPGRRDDGPSSINALTSMSIENRSALLSLQEVQTTGATEQDASAPSTDARELFLEYTAKTPAERYYESLLKSMGLTPDELAKLPPEERASIERMLRDRMRQHLGASKADLPS